MGVGLWTDVHHPPPLQLLASESKLSLSPTWPVYWLLRGEQPDPTTHSFSHTLTDTVDLELTQH